MEFSLRMKRAGYKTLLVPQIVSSYHARSHVGEYIRHNFVNGLWAIMPMKFVPHMPVALRHLVPLVFVSSLVCLGGLTLVAPLFLWLLVLVVLFYGAMNLFFSVQIANREGNLRYVLGVPLAFALLHTSYGSGSLVGSLRVLGSRQFWHNRLSRKRRRILTPEI